MCASIIFEREYVLQVHWLSSQKIITIYVINEKIITHRCGLSTRKFFEDTLHTVLDCKISYVHFFTGTSITNDKLVC